MPPWTWSRDQTWARTWAHMGQIFGLQVTECHHLIHTCKLQHCSRLLGSNFCSQTMFQKISVVEPFSVPCFPNFFQSILRSTHCFGSAKTFLKCQLGRFTHYCSEYNSLKSCGFHYGVWQFHLTKWSQVAATARTKHHEMYPWRIPSLLAYNAWIQDFPGILHTAIVVGPRCS